jgi:hypothetical protein
MCINGSQLESEDDKQLKLCFTTGVTIINHNAMNLTDFPDCTELGCDIHPIRYQATENQMKALADLSLECTQAISVLVMNFVLNHCFQK